MKKTVIKRRKRVPAVTAPGRAGSTAAGQSGGPSPVQPTTAMPGTPTPTAPLYTATPDGERSRHTPPFTPHESQQTSPSDLVRRTQNVAVPLVLSAPGGVERQKPWWVEDKTVDNGSKDRDGSVSPLSLLWPCLSFESLPPHCPDGNGPSFVMADPRVHNLLLSLLPFTVCPLSRSLRGVCFGVCAL
jgi:hypothetical protein